MCFCYSNFRIASQKTRFPFLLNWEFGFFFWDSFWTHMTSFFQKRFQVKPDFSPLLELKLYLKIYHLLLKASSKRVFLAFENP